MYRPITKPPPYPCLGYHPWAMLPSPCLERCRKGMEGAQSGKWRVWRRDGRKRTEAPRRPAKRSKETQTGKDTVDRAGGRRRKRIVQNWRHTDRLSRDSPLWPLPL